MKTTKEVAEDLGVTPATIRRWAANLELVPTETQHTGERGRPAALWSTEQVKTLRTAE